MSVPLSQEEEGPVFVVGCPRSGTSWTWGLLHDLPCFEPLLIEDFPGFTTSTGLGKMKEGDSYRTTETTVFFSDLSDERIRSAVEAKQATVPGKLLLEKTPSTVEKMDRILRIFPNARFIHLARDPRATINSILQTEFSNGFRFARDLDEAIDFLRRHYESARPYFDSPSVYLLSYEQLHADTEAALREMLHHFEWLDRVDPKDIARTVEQNRGKTKGMQNRLFRRGTVDSWKAELGPEAITRIERELDDVFRAYGCRRRSLFERFFGSR